MLDAHVAIWRERGLQTAKNPLLNTERRYQLYFRQYWGLQKWLSFTVRDARRKNHVSKGNAFADKAAERAAAQEALEML